MVLPWFSVPLPTTWQAFVAVAHLLTRGHVRVETAEKQRSLCRLWFGSANSYKLNVGENVIPTCRRYNWARTLVSLETHPEDR